MSAVTAPPISPFKGLAAFADSELDALFFFGRERERDVIVANMLATRLTVLYGESGVGKSSLLAAAVVPGLREAAGGPPVVLRDTWSGELEHLPSQFERDEEGYLVLDQFEEYFLYHDEELLRELPELLATTRVNVLIALREDSLARLDAFKASIPGVFANQLRLEHLDVEQARRAILGPLARWKELTGEHVDAEPSLVEAVVDDVAVGGRYVEAPYLQLVLERVWEAEREAGSWLMRRATLDRLGGAAAIVRDQFRGALEALPADEQDVAAAMLERLVTPTGTKIALDAADLAGYAEVEEDALRRVLARLTRDRIVHSVDGSDRYEIFHDVLAEPISAWRLERRFAAEQAAARRRQRRLVAVVVVALAALLAVSALAVWAFAERGSAQHEARHARARALDATALQQQLSDPNRSLRLAYAATQLDQTAATEAVLRQTLNNDRLRLVKHVQAPVTALAVSPRGDLIAAAVRGSRVLLLDAYTRRLVGTIQTPTPVAAAGFIADGRQLVTATSHGIAQLWDPVTGRRKPLRERTGAGRLPNDSLRLVPVGGDLARRITHVQDLSVTPDGSRIAAIVTAGDGAKRAWLFDRAGRLVRVLPPKGIRDLSFSPDGSLLATASALGYTILWHSSDGRHPRTLLEAKSGSYAIAFSPDGRYLASGGADGGVRVWNAGTGDRIYVNFATNPVTGVAWSPDGHAIATSSLDGNVLLWRMQGLVGAGSLAGTLAGSVGRIEALAFSPTAASLVTGGEDRIIRVWDARPDKQLSLLGRSPGAALDARWAGRTIVGLWPHVAKTFGAGSHELTHVLRGRGRAAFTSLGSSNDGALIAAGAADGTVDVWDGAGALVAASHDPSGVTAVAVSPRGDSVASGDRGGAITLRDAQGHVRWTTRQDGRVLNLEFAPDGTRLVAAGPHGAAIWRVSDGSMLRPLPSPLGDDRAVFSPDGTLVATAGLDANGRLWFAGSGRLYRVLRGHRQAVTDIVFSRDGRLVATSSRDADARVWNVDTGVHFLLQRAAFGRISHIAFDPSGRWVAGAAPISVILWTEASGRWLSYLRGHTDHLTAVAFAPHSPTLLTASLDGTLRTYTCDVCVGLDELVHLARVRLARTR